MSLPANLDSTSGQEVLSALRDVASDGRTVLVVTHDSSLANHSDVILYLQDGRLAQKTIVPVRLHAPKSEAAWPLAGNGGS